MSPESIRSMLRRSPFLPFRLYVSNQSSYVISRPDLVMVGANSTFIGILRNTGSAFWDVPVFLANEQITRLEPIVPETSSTPK